MSRSPAPVPSPLPRAATRHKIFAPTSLTGAGGEMRVHLLNVSATGALVHASMPPASGHRVQIRIGAEMVRAQIVWVDGARFGVVFDRALDATVIETALEIATNSSR